MSRKRVLGPVSRKLFGRQETGRVGTDPRTDGDEPRNHETPTRRGRFPISELTCFHDSRGAHKKPRTGIHGADWSVIIEK